LSKEESSWDTATHSRSISTIACRVGEASTTRLEGLVIDKANNARCSQPDVTLGSYDEAQR
jgi:hypothetical protein